MYRLNKDSITPKRSQEGLDYNRRLYAPGSPESRALFGPVSKPNLPGGYTGPTAPVQAGQYQTPYGTASVSRPGDALMALTDSPALQSPGYVPGMPKGWRPGMPTMGGMPAAGSAGPVGEPGATGGSAAYAPPAVDTAPVASMPPPAENSMQRWQNKTQDDGKMPELSPQRRYFWATGRIDGRAPQADPTRNKGYRPPTTLKRPDGSASAVGSGAPVTFNNTGWTPY